MRNNDKEGGAGGRGEGIYQDAEDGISPYSNKAYSYL